MLQHKEFDEVLYQINMAARQAIFNDPTLNTQQALARTDRLSEEIEELRMIWKRNLQAAYRMGLEAKEE